jgi:hypothetical protein
MLRTRMIFDLICICSISYGYATVCYPWEGYTGIHPNRGSGREGAVKVPVPPPILLVSSESRATNALLSLVDQSLVGLGTYEESAE